MAEPDKDLMLAVGDFESPPGPAPAEETPVLPPGDAPGQTEGDTHRGILKVDATVCEQRVKYPTDWDLLNRCRRESERLIDLLCKKLGLRIKPRTHRKKAQAEYLAVVKNKKKRRSQQARRVLVGKQLRYLRRNLGHIDNLLDRFDRIPFKRRDYKISMVIRHIYQQQLEMWRKKVNRCEDRIVSIYQPHVRPVVRGKAGKNVEFGGKITVSLDDGFARIDFFSWDAFHEGGQLIQQVLFYKDQHGYWPQKVVADQIYGSLENRNYLKKIGVQFQVKPLGRPAKTPKKTKEKPITRNDIEGKFGEGKNGFNLDEIRATRSDTSKSWIAAIFFVMNINEAFRRTEQWLLRFKTVISAMFRATHSASTYSGALYALQNLKCPN